VEKRLVTSESQTSNSVLLVRPAAFGFHAEAAQSNAFATVPIDADVRTAALDEFEGLARRLSQARVNTLILDDTASPPKPDALFPNNWVSFHRDGTIVLYPMATEARRLERNLDGITALLTASGFAIRRVVDLTDHERFGRFLEGTGSLILDRPRRQAYASVSARTARDAIADFDDQLDYSTMVFEAADAGGQAIYHTNVLMSLGTRFAVLCVEAVAAGARSALIAEIEASGRTLIALDEQQMRSFACNIIELQNRDGDPVIALSSAALAAFTPDQRRLLEGFGELVDAPIPTIEAVGGGSVRCMIADIHLPRRLR
jgi:hypothetical protein